jgi:hypothetical protein
MANFKPEINTKEGVIAYYNMCNKPCYQVIVGSSQSGDVVCDWFDEHNSSGGEEQLEKFLEFVEENKSNTNVYTFLSVDTHSEKNKNGAAIKVVQGKAIRFQLNNSGLTRYEKNDMPITPITHTIEKSIAVPNNSEFLIFLKERISYLENENNLLRNEIEFLKQQQEDEEEDDEDPAPITGKDRLMNTIAGIAENEAFQMALIGIAGNLMDRFMPVKKIEENTTI